MSAEHAGVGARFLLVHRLTVRLKPLEVFKLVER